MADTRRGRQIPLVGRRQVGAGGPARAVVGVVALARTEVSAVDTPRRWHARARFRPYAISVAAHRTRLGRTRATICVRPFPARHGRACPRTKRVTHRLAVQLPRPPVSNNPYLVISTEALFPKLSTPPLLHESTNPVSPASSHTHAHTAVHLHTCIAL